MPKPVPDGVTYQTATITDGGRKHRGDNGAFDEAVAKLERDYRRLVEAWPAGTDVKIHLALFFERTDLGDQS